MSGHSKWNNIKRAKGAADAKRGKIFTKIGRHISMAVRTGGGADPNFNFKLRMAIDQAKEAGMTKDTIERALSKGAGEGKESIVNMVYEGHGPAGSAFIVEAITDNSNRTLQSVRNIFVKHNGRLGEQGSVGWMFESRGQLLVENQIGSEGLPLELIDQGVEDVRESEEGLEIYTLPMDLEKIKKFVETKGLRVASAEVIMKPNQPVIVTEKDVTKVHILAEALEDDDDVTAVHTNVNL